MLTIGKYSLTDRCLCGADETVEATGPNGFHARMCAACMMVLISRAEANGHDRGSSPARSPKNRSSKRNSQESALPVATPVVSESIGISDNHSWSDSRSSGTGVSEVNAHSS